MTETIVVKAGGDIVENDEYLRYLLEDIRFLYEHGNKLALVYGGKNRITEEIRLRHDIESEFSLSGNRITTERTIDAEQYALDKLGEETAGFFDALGFRNYDLFLATRQETHRFQAVNELP
jgi:acetylglutamate kinase